MPLNESNPWQTPEPKLALIDSETGMWPVSSDPNQAPNENDPSIPSHPATPQNPNAPFAPSEDDPSIPAHPEPELQREAERNARDVSGFGEREIPA